MSHSLYIRTFFLAALLALTACGQTGPLVAPPDEPAAAAAPTDEPLEVTE